MGLPKVCSEKSFKVATGSTITTVIIALLAVLQPGINANADDLMAINDKINQIDKTTATAIAVSNERFIQIARDQAHTKDNTKMIYDKLDDLYIIVCSHNEFNCT